MRDGAHDVTIRSRQRGFPHGESAGVRRRGAGARQVHRRPRVRDPRGAEERRPLIGPNRLVGVERGVLGGRRGQHGDDGAGPRQSERGRGRGCHGPPDRHVRRQDRHSSGAQV